MANVISELADKIGHTKTGTVYMDCPGFWADMTEFLDTPLSEIYSYDLKVQIGNHVLARTPIELAEAKKRLVRDLSRYLYSDILDELVYLRRAIHNRDYYAVLEKVRKIEDICEGR